MPLEQADSRARSSTQAARLDAAAWLRVAFATLLVAGAAAWPLLNLGERRSVFTIYGSHGVDSSDLLAIWPALGAVVVMFFPWQYRLPLRVCIRVAAAGLALGLAFGFVWKVADLGPHRRHHRFFPRSAQMSRSPSRAEESVRQQQRASNSP